MVTGKYFSALGVRAIRIFASPRASHQNGIVPTPSVECLFPKSDGLSVRYRSRLSSRRRPLASFPPEISNPMDLVPDFDLRQGQVDQMDKAAMEDYKSHYSQATVEKDDKRSQKAAHKTSIVHSVTSDEISEEAVNVLSPSHEMFLRKSGLPKIIRIHGWDKKNANLKNLRRIFFRKTAKAPTWIDNREENEGEQENHSRSEERREDDGIVVLEGKRLICEAMNLGLDPYVFISSQISLFQNFPLDKVKNKDRIQLFLVPYNTMSGWSDLTTSTGFMAAFRKKDILEGIKRAKNKSLPMTLVMDNVRNPDNFGGILRMAAAAGCRRVIATSGCVDAWQPKVLRAAAGTHFRIPIETKKHWREMEQYLPSDRQVVVCNMQQKPLEGDDSEFTSQQADLINECKSYRCKDPSSGKTFDYSFDEDELVGKFSGVSLRNTELRDLQVDGGKHLVIMVGGETEGISAKAHKFAVENDGQQAFVNMFNGMDSLNVLSATSIIMHHCQCHFPIC